MSKCDKCKNLQKSVYMKLSDDDILYNYWCSEGETPSENCGKFEE